MASGYFEVKTLLPPQFLAARLKEKLGKTSFQLKDFFRSKAAKRELKIKNVGFIVNIWSYQVLYQRLLGVILGVIRGFSLSASFWPFSLFGCHQMDEVFFRPFSAFFGGCFDQSFYFKIDTPMFMYLLLCRQCTFHLH